MEIAWVFIPYSEIHWHVPNWLSKRGFANMDSVFSYLDLGCHVDLDSDICNSIKSLSYSFVEFQPLAHGYIYFENPRAHLISYIQLLFSANIPPIFLHYNLYKLKKKKFWNFISCYFTSYLPSVNSFRVNKFHMHKLIDLTLNDVKVGFKDHIHISFRKKHNLFVMQIFSYDLAFFFLTWKSRCCSSSDWTAVFDDT